jgi:hypothetical protein
MLIIKNLKNAANPNIFYLARFIEVWPYDIFMAIFHSQISACYTTFTMEIQKNSVD